MCKCMDELRESLKELPNKMDGWNERNIKEVLIDNSCILFNTKVNPERFYSPVKIKYEQKNKKGEWKLKKTTVNIQYKYCPLCGKPYEGGK
ncbi:hypothetical protein ACP49_09230 [Clostridium botulinum]|uniref:hypothetical protein n=1 Tax=Clostridium botulinum TaxID=1491 RepID=UPI0006A72A92|nr:hypothetical protein [Clostridium botulinum]KOM97243.1 hypothetical protein ACP53_04120 [Clostridium botulinum]KON00746.1 hypothetical protein ACP49_09230 [Clostridium botulinum]MBY7003521.1 hypothetical protein [Clostridium botulinum]MCR1146005.1 hypothetical protein [Clostridium botulinum]NFH93129.1 hypothetical protein [Clostridium botulinum]